MSRPKWKVMGLAFHRRTMAVVDDRLDFLCAAVCGGCRSSQGYFARAAERLVLDYTMFEIKILRGEKQNYIMPWSSLACRLFQELAIIRRLAAAFPCSCAGSARTSAWWCQAVLCLADFTGSLEACFSMLHLRSALPSYQGWEDHLAFLVAVHET